MVLCECMHHNCYAMCTFPSSFFGHVCKITKSDRFIMSVHPSACNNSAPTEWIFMQFYIQAFLENLSKKVVIVKLTRMINLIIFLAKHCTRPPDDRSSVIRNMLEHFQIFYNFHCIYIPYIVH